MREGKDIPPELEAKLNSKPKVKKMDVPANTDTDEVKLLNEKVCYLHFTLPNLKCSKTSPQNK